MYVLIALANLHRGFRIGQAQNEASLLRLFIFCQSRLDLRDIFGDAAAHCVIVERCRTIVIPLPIIVTNISRAPCLVSRIYVRRLVPGVVEEGIICGFQFFFVCFTPTGDNKHILWGIGINVKKLPIGIRQFLKLGDQLWIGGILFPHHSKLVIQGVDYRLRPTLGFRLFRVILFILHLDLLAEISDSLDACRDEGTAFADDHVAALYRLKRLLRRRALADYIVDDTGLYACDVVHVVESRADDLGGKTSSPGWRNVRHETLVRDKLNKSAGDRLHGSGGLDVFSITDRTIRLSCPIPCQFRLVFQLLNFRRCTILWLNLKPKGVD